MLAVPYGPDAQIWWGATLSSGARGSVVTGEGTVLKVLAAGQASELRANAQSGSTVWDARGWVMVPRLVDAHVHLDKTLWGSAWLPHRSAASLLDRVAIERAVLDDPSLEPTAARARALLDHLVSRGVTAVRSHVDISGSLGLSRLEPLLAIRERFKDLVDLQLVAFPQEGVMRAAGAAEAMRAAVAGGCDVVGGLDPHSLDGDRAGQLGVVIALAAEFGRGLDVHLHERGEEGATTLLHLAELVTLAGLSGKAAVSHGFALADLYAGDRARFDLVSDALAAAGVSVVTSLPGEGLCPPVAALSDRGVNVVVASDNIRDSWSPFGRGDPLERACLAAYLAGWRTDDSLARALDLVSVHSSTLLGLRQAALEPGNDADFTLVRAGSLAEAIVGQSPDRVVVRRGRPVSGAALIGAVEPASV